MANRLRRSSAALAGIAVCGTTVVCGHAQSPSPASPPIISQKVGQPSLQRPAVSPLSIVPENGVMVTGPGRAQWNAGEVDPAKTPHLERAFSLKNETPNPVLIGQLRGSCGCETILLTKDNRPLRQVTLQPGEQAQLRVSIRMAGQHSGEMHKMVWAYSPGSTTPLATIDIALAVRAFILASPSLVNFGKINSGMAASMPLTVSVDASLLPGGRFPPLTSSNSDVSVLAEGTPQQTQRSGKPWTEQKYRVTVRAQNHAGLLSGALHFASADTSRPSTSDKTGAGASPLPISASSSSSSGAPMLAFSIPLTGEVAGGLTFTPRTVYLGSMAAGQGAKRQVILSGGTRDKLQKLVFTSTSPWVKVTAGSGGSEGVQIVEIILDRQAPVGVLQAQILATTPGGEKLTLPVIVEITKI